MKKQPVIQKVDPIVTAAIMEKANREALVEWAKRCPPPLPTFGQLPPLRLTPATAYAFGRHVIKRTRGILTP